MSKISDPPTPISISYQMFPYKATILVDGADVTGEITDLWIRFDPRDGSVSLERARLEGNRMWRVTDEYIVDTFTATVEGKLT